MLTRDDTLDMGRRRLEASSFDSIQRGPCICYSNATTTANIRNGLRPRAISLHNRICSDKEYMFQCIIQRLDILKQRPHVIIRLQYLDSVIESCAGVSDLQPTLQQHSSCYDPRPIFHLYPRSLSLPSVEIPPPEFTQPTDNHLDIRSSRRTVIVFPPFHSPSSLPPSFPISLLPSAVQSRISWNYLPVGRRGSNIVSDRLWVSKLLIVCRRNLRPLRPPYSHGSKDLITVSYVTRQMACHKTVTSHVIVVSSSKRRQLKTIP